MKRFSEFYILTAAFFWGILGIFVRELEKLSFSPIDIVAIRCTGSACLLLIYILLFDRKALKIKWKDFWVFLGTGIGSIAFFNFCYFYAIQVMSISIAAALLYTAPAFVSVMAYIFLKEKITSVQIGAVLLAMTGCALVSGIVGATLSLNFMYFMTGLGAGFGYALYSIFGKCAIRKGYSNLTITFYTFLTAGIAVFPMLDQSVLAENFFDSGFLCSVMFMIVFSTVLAYFLYTMGLSGVDAGYASILSCFEPVVACLISTCIYHENMNMAEWSGLILILVSAVLSGVSALQRKKGRK